MTTPAEPTAAELSALAADTEALATRIRSTHSRLAAADGTAPDGRYGAIRQHLDHAASVVHDTAKTIKRAADDYDHARRLAAMTDTTVCTVPWGVCPEHGNTLRSTAGESWCEVVRCGRRWTYDRLDRPCGQPLTHHITDTDRAEFDVCNGHALDAEQRLEGATITRIAPLV